MLFIYYVYTIALYSQHLKSTSECSGSLREGASLVGGDGQCMMQVRQYPQRVIS